MELLASEWASLGLRWLHVIAAIAWIGSSFYFIALDLALRDPGGLPAGVKGETWQVHGGGFYRMQKYQVAPPELPAELTWFKWEAYTTFLSGFALLLLVYYLNPELYLIDPAVMALSPGAAVAIGMGSLLVGWLAYEALCRSPLGRDDRKLALAGFALLVLAAWGYTRIFSGRGAFLHLGALVGTAMVASVAMVIIPNQKKVIASLMRGEAPDPRLGAEARQRSLHNNYLTLPVLFTMISNHYPLTFGVAWSWVGLSVVFLVGFAVRHFFNERHKGRPAPWWTWGVAAAGMAVVIALGSRPPATGGAAEAAPPVTVDAEAAITVVQGRCSMCHGPEPAWDGVAVAPGGVLLHEPDAIRRAAPLIELQAVRSHAMPPGNVTLITQEERAILAAWLAAGAPAP